MLQATVGDPDVLRFQDVVAAESVLQDPDGKIISTGRLIRLPVASASNVLFVNVVVLTSVVTTPDVGNVADEFCPVPPFVVPSTPVMSFTNDTVLQVGDVASALMN